MAAATSSLLLLGLVGCSGGGTASPESSGAHAAPEVIKVGVAALWLSAPIYVARDKGFFKDENLDVQIVPVANTPAMVAAIDSGSMDVGVGALTTEFQAFAQGLDIKLLAPNGGLQKGLQITAVAKEGPITSPKQLEGKTVCVNVLNGQDMGQQKWWLATQGVDVSKVKFIAIPFQAMVSALKSGNADACDLAAPYAGTALDAGEVRNIGQTSQFFGPYGSPATAYFSSGSFTTEHSDSAKRFVKAMMKTHDYLDKNPSEANAVLPLYTGVTETEAKNSPMGTFPTEFDLSLLQMVADRSVDVGLVSRSIKVKDFVWSGAPVTGK